MILNGYKVVASEYYCDIVQARKHRKKRINKKWLKRYGMKSVPRKDLLIFDGYIVGQPSVIDKLIEGVRKREEEERSANLS